MVMGLSLGNVVMVVVGGFSGVVVVVEKRWKVTPCDAHITFNVSRITYVYHITPLIKRGHIA